MWDTIQKLEYRAAAKIPDAQKELDARLSDRMELPLPGLHGEKLYLTGVKMLREKAKQLDMLYRNVPKQRGVKDTILLDAWSSATIEGARTTVAQVKKSFASPETKDDKMVVNTTRGCHYAYGRPITQKNIRRLWEMVVSGVCENETHKGKQYRDGMVHIGNNIRIIHTPAAPEQIPELMKKWFAYCEEASADLLIQSFVLHFYFVYVHPFCDGNGRLARILNSSFLYHNGYLQAKSLPLSNAINQQISGYYGSLSDSESVLFSRGEQWLDLSPFVSYMLDSFERCLIDAALAKNRLNETETKLLQRMNKVGIHAEITVAKAAKIIDRTPSATRTILNNLVQKGYLTVDTSHTPYIFRLDQHIPSNGN